MAVTKRGEMRLYVSIRPGRQATLSVHFKSASNPAAAQSLELAQPRRMSAFGPERTSLVAPHMSAFGGKADIV
jgi:hypothetical protein